jgi:hypothetical protein
MHIVVTKRQVLTQDDIGWGVGTFEGSSYLMGGPLQGLSSEHRVGPKGTEMVQWLIMRNVTFHDSNLRKKSKL